MSFWGVEVKSGKPYTIAPDDFDKGRLHISQATLGLGSSKEKSVVQCNVGNNPGVLLCSLMPRRKETCSLSLIFDEEEEVILSVLGQNSVHLTGYFIPDEENEGDNVPGEELGSSDSEDYSGDSNEDEYEKDFIDDDVDEDDSEEEELVFPSRGRKSSVRIEELEDEPEPPAELANGANKKKKKDKKESEVKKDKKKKDEVTLEKKSDATKKKDEVTLEKKSDATKKKDEVTLEKKSDATKKEDKDGSESDSEDEDGFPLPGKRKKQSNNSGQPAKKQMMEIDGASLSKPSETSEPHASEDTPKDSKNSQSVIEPEDATKDSKKSKKKKKKKKSKNKESENNAEAATEEDPKASADLIRTFGNGMIVETLSLGKPDGKKAVGGKKVSMYYVGRLKSGKIFDSKTSGKPFQFRLGVGEVIPGWDVGVEGMRVGDKRRLTVPPAMGYGPKGSPPVIPGNAWLIFEVELIDVK